MGKKRQDKENDWFDLIRELSYIRARAGQEIDCLSICFEIPHEITCLFSKVAFEEKMDMDELFITCFESYLRLMLYQQPPFLPRPLEDKS